MINTVIFDMDGLMFDTERVNKAMFYKMGEKLNLTVTEEMLSQMLGLNREADNRLLKKWYGEKIDPEYLWEVVEEFLKEELETNGVPKKPGLMELLEYLNCHGYYCLVATSTPQYKAEPIIRQAGIYDYFDGFVYGTEVERSKPYPDIFLEAMHRVNVEPESAIVLEDSYNGVEAGFASGAQTYMIPDLMEPSERCREICEKVLTSLYDVIDILKEQDRYC